MDVGRASLSVAMLILVVVVLTVPVSYSLEGLLHEEKFPRPPEERVSDVEQTLLELEILLLVEEVREEVESIRGLEFAGPVNVMIINTSWAVETWAPKEEQGIPPELLYRELVYKLTFLIEFNRSIVEAEKAWVGMFLAASAGNTLYINRDYFNPNRPESRNVLAHELTHILQGMHFNINCGGTTDASLACSALVEGDAGWVQHLYCLKTRLCTPSPPTELYLEDLYLSLNLFPYIYGERFVRYLYELGEWDLVNEAYRKPPISTLMLMHPRKYLEYLYSDEGAPTEPVISGGSQGELVYSDTLGPYYILLILAKRIGVEKAEAIVRYWAGDRVELYSTANNSAKTWILLWNITWGTTYHAKQFYGNFTQVLAWYGELVNASENKVLVKSSSKNGAKASFTLILSNNHTLLRAEYIEEGS